MIDYQALDDNKLVNLLFTGEDRLPRQAVDEFIRRGERMIKPLSNIVFEEMNWTKDRPEFWAPIHAVFILGAIGAQEAVSPLITAIKWSEKYNVDWVFETFPSIFGKIGIPALESLRQCVQDKEQDWYIRTIAIQGLASIALKNPEVADEIFAYINSFCTNIHENMDFRVPAANTLLDFVRSEYKESLLAFCQEERRYREKEPFPIVAFEAEDVERIFSADKKDIALYTRDWLSFYDKEHIRRRQERWKEEAKRETAKDYKGEYEEVAEQSVQGIPKIGRNSPCPCGSGKKHKKCCMRDES
ncbi:MAG TPA: SEC-C metal-binding domain-containing protein [Candidatus Brocadiaceae bacterium]